MPPRELFFSLVETLGAMVGDPDLPNHLKSGYMGALDLAVELEAKLAKLKQVKTASALIVDNGNFGCPYTFKMVPILHFY